MDRNGSVNCTVGPQDQVLVSRLQAALGGVQRLDVVQQSRWSSVAFQQ